MNNPIIKAPYLITSRVFPQNPVELEPTLSKMYVDIALAVNARTIGIFEKFQIVTGESWFNDTNPQLKRQTYRQVYTIPSLPNATTLIVPHNIDLPPNGTFTKIYGTATDRTNFLPLPFYNVATSDGITLYCTRTDIVIITTTATWVNYSAIIVLEYLLN